MLFALIAVCIVCVFTLIACYEFRKQCQQLDRLLCENRKVAAHWQQEACAIAASDGSVRIAELESLRDAYAEQVADLNEMVRDLQERLDRYEENEHDSDDDSYDDYGYREDAVCDEIHDGIDY